jgi:hypothetical protein
MKKMSSRKASLADLRRVVDGLVLELAELKSKFARLASDYADLQCFDHNIVNITTPFFAKGGGSGGSLDIGNYCNGSSPVNSIHVPNFTWNQFGINQPAQQSPYVMIADQSQTSDINCQDRDCIAAFACGSPPSSVNLEIDMYLGRAVTVFGSQGARMAFGVRTGTSVETGSVRIVGIKAYDEIALPGGRFGCNSVTNLGQDGVTANFSYNYEGYRANFMLQVENGEDTVCIYQSDAGYGCTIYVRCELSSIFGCYCPLENNTISVTGVNQT